MMLWFIAAAIAELTGCYAVWLWGRDGSSPAWLVVAVTTLFFFAWALTRTPAPTAGRTFAAYGGVYLLVALAWGVIVARFRPDRWDLIGAAMALAGAAVMLYGPRAQ